MRIPLSKLLQLRAALESALKSVPPAGLTCSAILCGTMLSLEARGQQVVPGSIPAACATLQPIGGLPTNQVLSLAIGLPLRNQPALNALLGQLYDSGITNYHRFLTPDQFAASFGPADQDYQAVVAFAQAQKMTVFNNRPGRILVDVTGTVAQIQQAFHVHLLLYQHPTESRTFFAPDVEPSVNLAVPLYAITGLNNYSVPRPLGSSTTGSGPGGTFLGNDFRAAYAPGVSLTGAGQTIALLAGTGLFVQGDISKYEQAAGLPNVPVVQVSVDSCVGCNTTAAFEITMDIELAISMAPGLSAVVVYSGSGNGTSSWYDDCLDWVASPTNLPISYQVSASFGADKDANTPQLYQRMAAQGQSYFNSSGDESGIAPGTP